MLVINFDTDKPEDIKAKLYHFGHMVAINVGVIPDLCELLPECNCFRILSIEGEVTKGIWMTFEGHNGTRRVCVQPPPAHYAKETT